MLLYIHPDLEDIYLPCDQTLFSASQTMNPLKLGEIYDFCHVREVKSFTKTCKAYQEPWRKPSEVGRARLFSQNQVYTASLLRSKVLLGPP